MGCREPQHPRLGARVVIRRPYVGKSRPSVTQAEAPRWPITAPMSALSATRAGRWPRHGPRGPRGSIGSGLALWMDVFVDLVRPWVLLLGEEGGAGRAGGGEELQTNAFQASFLPTELGAEAGVTPG